MSLAGPFAQPIIGGLPLGSAERRAAAADAEATIAKGSKSFAAASRLFGADMRASAMMLYSWCRHCDDVVDDQILGFRRPGAPSMPADAARLAELEDKTVAAVRGRRTGEAPFDAIGDVALRHALPEALLLQHIAGFRMDVDGRRYETIEDTLDYCYHVAGVVGVMMARIMGVGTKGEAAPALTVTLDRACDLGLAFQLTNIARDIVEDAAAGRVYVPDEWLRDAAIAPDDLHQPARRETVSALALRLIDCAEPYYASARIGLGALPPRAALAVATALGVYREIGVTVRRKGAAAWDERARTGAWQKLAHVGRGGGKVVLSRLSPAREHTRPSTLWTRPRLAAIDSL